MRQADGGLVFRTVAVACWYMTAFGRPMFRVPFPVFRPGVALAMLALNVMTTEHAYGWIFGARDEVDIRPVREWAQEDGRGVIPFPTYATEKQSIMDALPCKWISQSGSDADDGLRKADGDSRYDFLCKGGNWATVSLMLDTAPGYSNGLSRVRLFWREWPETVHPGGGEAFVAQQFLKHVADRLVPADLSEQVQSAFFGQRSRSWWAGKILHIRYTSEDNRTHIVHRLEIDGLGRAVSAPGALLPAASKQVQAAPEIQRKPPAAEATGLVTPGAKPLPKALPQEAVPLPLPAPVDMGDDPVNPNGLAIPPSVKMPEAPVEEPTGTSPSLVPATPADFSAQPDPDSLKQEAAPPPVSATMVPDSQDVLRGRPEAPTNFDAYNKAEELTRKFEAGAMVKPGEANKVVSSTVVAPSPVQSQSGLAKDEPAPPVAPIPTPVVNDGRSGLEVQPAAQTQPTEVDGAQPAADPRFETDRPLPQLKFVPKARPVDRPDRVIQFEDEKSAL